MGDFKIIWTKSWLLKGNFINKNYDRRNKNYFLCTSYFFKKNTDTWRKLITRKHYWSQKLPFI